jgi:hypothetical protein
MWTDNIVSTSTGAGVALTTLNGGSVYTLSSKAKGFKWFAPVQAATAAYTAAQTSLQKFSIVSNSIAALQPKRVAMSPTHGGLGTFAGVQVPIIRAFDANVPLGEGSNIPLTFQGQAYVANTAAFRVGATIGLTTEPPMQKQAFWEAVEDETLTGTAAAQVSIGQITVNNATRLKNLYGHIGVGTVTASESYIGQIEANSPDLSPIQTVRAYIQPVGAGLGTAVEVLQPDAKYWDEDLMLNPTATISAQGTLDESLTAQGNYVWGIGFER